VKQLKLFSRRKKKSKGLSQSRVKQALVKQEMVRGYDGIVVPILSQSRVKQALVKQEMELI